MNVPLPALRRMTPRELAALLRRARRRAEREWTRASLRVDALVAAQDALREGRLP
jgi:RNA-binding protein YlmH